MPLVGEGKNIRYEYHIPDEIKSKIPDYFYFAFAGELCSVFGHKIFEKDEDGTYGLFYVSSTAGWTEAFRAASEKTDILWLFTYYTNLEWFDSDHFDGEMEDEIISRFVEAEHSGSNAYYQFLLKKNHPSAT